MKYSVELFKSASSYLRRLDKIMRVRILKRLEELADDPLVHSKALQGTEARLTDR